MPGADPWTAVVEAAVHRTRPVVLTVATLLTIFFVPALYAAWFRVAQTPGPAAAGTPALAH